MENNILQDENTSQNEKKDQSPENTSKPVTENSCKKIVENDSNATATVNVLKKEAAALLENINQKKVCNIKRCGDFLKYVTAQECPDLYKDEECLNTLFSVYMSLFQALIQHAGSNFENMMQNLEELDILMNNVFKQMLIVLKDPECVEKIKQKYASTVLSYSFNLLFNDNVSLDVRTKLGLIFIYTYDSCVDTESSVCLRNYINSNFSEASIENAKNLKYFNLLNEIAELYKSNDYIVIVYSSILSIVSEETLFTEGTDGKSLISILYDGILDTAKRKTAQPPLILEISKTISLMGKYLRKFPTEMLKPMFLEGLYYVYSHLEHFIDTVRNHTKTFYADLVSLAAYHYSKGYTELIHIILKKNSKDVVENSSIRLLTYDYVSKYVDCDFLMNYFKYLPEVLFSLIVQESTLSDQVCKTYINIMQKGCSDITTEPDRTEWINSWVLVAINMLKLDPSCLKFCQKIILSAFSQHPTIIWQIFPIGNIGGTEEHTIFLQCINHARKSGIQLTSERDNPLFWRGLLEKQKMEALMVHQDGEIRLLVLTCIVETLKSTELYSDWELIFLINFIRCNITFQSPSYRKLLITGYKKALARFNASSRVIYRNLINKKQNQRELTKFTELKRSYRRFIINVTKILVGNLSYDSNFPRRACSLELLLVIKDILLPEEWKGCWTEEDVKNSHNILFDTYESNKRMIIAILKTLPPHYLGFTNVNFTSKYLQRCIDLALDVKPSRSLTAAYLFEVCSFSPFFHELIPGKPNENNKNSLTKEQESVLNMVVVLTKKFINLPLTDKLEEMHTSSTYGLMLALRRILETRDTSALDIPTYACMFDFVVAKCFEIREKILPVVCDPSPEGYLPPMDDNSPEDLIPGDETSRAQMIVVYSWRTMKEMTLLLAEIVKKIIKHVELEIKSRLAIEIGEFFVELFILSKHRGVFEQAYVGFSKICEIFWSCNHSKILFLPKKWLEQVVDVCTGKKPSMNLCPTRRSAGIPFMILAILSTEPTFQKLNFHKTMESLLTAAENNNTKMECQMHCMNVLRAIFRHSKLGELVAPYVARGVILSIKGFKDESWGIRNSATLLYSALITRIFGVQRTQNTEELCTKNRLTVRIFFLRYPELSEFLLDTLSKECKNSDSLILHPVLMILARLYPSQLEDTNKKMDLFLPYVNDCLSNIVLRTRELAARASVSFINSKNVTDLLENCFGTIERSKDIRSNNEIHGLLLQVYHLIKNNVLENVPLNKYLKSSMHILKLVDQKYSPTIVNLYMEVVIQLLYSESHLDEDIETYKEILMILSYQTQKHFSPSIASEKFLQNSFILSLIIILNKFEDCDLTYQCVNNLIFNLLHSANRNLKKFVFYFLIALNQSFSSYLDKSYEKHPLFECEDVCIPQELVELVDSLDGTSITEIARVTHQQINTYVSDKLENCTLNGEGQVLLFLLAEFYPCSFRYLKKSTQETLEFLLSYCNSDNEQLVSAALRVVSIFLSEDIYYNIKTYDYLVEVLSRNASPAAAIHQRLTVCEFLCKNVVLFCNEMPILRDKLLCRIFSIVLVLLEDEELEVRNCMSNFDCSFKLKFKADSPEVQLGQNWPVVPERAREHLLLLATLVLPKGQAISLLFSSACRHFPDRSREPFEIFERGDLNSYAENTPLIDVCSRILIKMLWTLPKGLSYEDHSIFLEEQTLLVTTLILDSFEKYDMCMMSQKTKLSVICALKSIFKFSERVEVGNDFAVKFKTYLCETIMHYLTTHLEHCDLFCVKRFIRKLYDPVFK